jgi:hypothetical protein
MPSMPELTDADRRLAVVSWLAVPVWPAIPLLVGWAYLAAGTSGQLRGDFDMLLWVFDWLSPWGGRNVAYLPFLFGAAVLFTQLGLIATLAWRSPRWVRTHARRALLWSAMTLPAALLAPFVMGACLALPADPSLWAGPLGEPELVRQAKLGAALGLPGLLLAMPAGPATILGLRVAREGSNLAPVPGRIWVWTGLSLVTTMLVLGSALLGVHA